MLRLEAAFLCLFSIEIKQLAYQHLNSFVFLVSLYLCLIFPIYCLLCPFGVGGVCLSCSCPLFCMLAVAAHHVCPRLVEYYSQCLISSKLRVVLRSFYCLMNKCVSPKLCSPQLTLYLREPQTEPRKMTQSQAIHTTSKLCLMDVYLNAAGESVKLLRSKKGH